MDSSCFVYVSICYRWINSDLSQLHSTQLFFPYVIKFFRYLSCLRVKVLVWSYDSKCINLALQRNSNISLLIWFKDSFISLKNSWFSNFKPTLANWVPRNEANNNIWLDGWVFSWWLQKCKTHTHMKVSWYWK